MELANNRVGRGFPAIPTNELLPCRQQMTFPIIQRKIERMVVFMLWLLTFVTTLAAKNGAFVHRGNILVTAKMVICVSVAKIKLHTAVSLLQVPFWVIFVWFDTSCLLLLVNACSLLFDLTLYPIYTVTSHAAVSWWR